MAALETALVLPLLLMICLGAFEYGMAFREWLSVTTATREGVRLAATSGSFNNADCLILEATAGALQSLDTAAIHQVWIYESDAAGTVPPSSNAQVFRPKTEEDVDLVCGEWVRLQDGWPFSARSNEGSDRDWVGVRLVFKHQWITGFLWWSGDVTWTDDAVMRMEPNYDF